MTDVQKRVLIVDDEEDLTWTLSKKLSKDSDKFELICVNSGQEAVEVLNQLPFDLVITDVRMPEVSGLDLLVEVKRQYPQTKVIIMTAYGTSDVQQEAADRGCFEYIEKPFEINELRQLILDALRKKKGFEGSVSDFQLSDIIQLNCLGRLTSALRVNCDGESGMIFFQEGNIVHSHTRNLQGESAFYHIMSWQGGEFEVLRNQPPPVETITKGWQSLLLESLRRIDENSDLARAEADREKRRRQARIQEILGTVFKLEGVQHVVALTSGGFVLAYSGELSPQPEKISELGSHLATLLDSVGKSSSFIKGGKVEAWDMQLSKRYLCVQAIPKNDAFLSIVGSGKMNYGLIRLEIRKHLRELSKLI